VVDEVICTNFLPVVLSFHFVILSEAKDPTRNHKDPCEAHLQSTLRVEFAALSVTKNVKVHLFVGSTDCLDLYVIYSFTATKNPHPCPSP